MIKQYIKLYIICSLNYPLVLEYADGGMLRKNLRESQLKFAKKIAISCLHDYTIDLVEGILKV